MRWPVFSMKSSNPPTMAILLDLAMADGILPGNEQEILQTSLEKFGISEDALKPVIDIITLKNHFSV
jgi:hypothetical protein